MEEVPEIRETLKTWDVGRVAEVVAEDERALVEVLGVLRSGDGTLKIRALTALIESTRGSNWKERKRVLELGLDEIIAAAGSDDDRISSRALELLAILLKNNPLTDRRLAPIIEVILKKSTSKSPRVWSSIMEVIESIKIPYVSKRTTSLLLRALRDGTAEEIAVASLVLIRSGAVERNDWKLLVERIADLINSNSERLIDAGLTASIRLTKLPVVFPMDAVIKAVLPALRRLLSSCSDQFIKVKAIDAFDRLREMVTRYYRLHPREAQRVAEELARLGLVEEAYLVSSSAGTFTGEFFYGNRTAL
ncbi:hypothetical protein [Thermococcus sp.]|uniref:hypothetical protein n=1 Tax=Thermococcus sp. TaxID=35749 RepID=UPI00260AAA34|nr:hypothetical protein [Thermococcus sp.]